VAIDDGRLSPRAFADGNLDRSNASSAGPGVVWHFPDQIPKWKTEGAVAWKTQKYSASLS